MTPAVLDSPPARESWTRAARAPHRGSRWPIALLVALASFGIYLSNGRTIGSGDPLPTRYLPWSLLRDQTFALDAFPTLFDESARRSYPLLDGIPYYLLHPRGHYVSAYPPGPAIAALPVYAVPALSGARPSPELT